MKYCQFCGAELNENASFCGKCGRQVGEFNRANNQQAVQQPNIIINNTAIATANVVGGRQKDKWLAVILCCVGFFGIGGLHKFYEGKVFMGILYLVTCGLCGIGTIIDLIVLLCKPNPYCV